MIEIQKYYNLFPNLVDSSFVDYESDLLGTNKIAQHYIGRLKANIFEAISPFWVRLNHPDIYKIQMAARTNGGLTGSYQWLRLWEITKIIKKWEIKSVLEFGSGSSSSMFAKLIGNKENFISVEESEYWAERTLKFAGEYSNKMNLICSNRVVEMRDNESCTRYNLESKFYKQYYDMIYIDGPTAKRKESDLDDQLKISDTKGRMPNVDIEHMIEHGVYPKLIVIDGRRATVRRLIHKVSSSYNMILRYFYEHPDYRSGQYFYHTIFIRK